MNKLCKALALLCVLTLMCAVSSGALARTEPNSKTIEETNTYDYGSLKITIDRWCYAFNKTSLRFFVANVYVDDPAQLKTAFAGEKYSKDAVEAPMDIAARHDAVLATNGDYYNFKDKSGLVIRGGELYRDLATSRHQLLVYADGRFEALLPADYKQGTGAQYIEAGVVQSFMFGPLLVDNYEITELPEKYFILSLAGAVHGKRLLLGCAPGGREPLRRHRRRRPPGRLERPGHDAAGAAGGLCRAGLPHRLQPGRRRKRDHGA